MKDVIFMLIIHFIVLNQIHLKNVELDGTLGSRDASDICHSCPKEFCEDIDNINFRESAGGLDCGSYTDNYIEHCETEFMNCFSKDSNDVYQMSFDGTLISKRYASQVCNLCNPATTPPITTPPITTPPTTTPPITTPPITTPPITTPPITTPPATTRQSQHRQQQLHQQQPRQSQHHQ